MLIPQISVPIPAFAPPVPTPKEDLLGFPLLRLDPDVLAFAGDWHGNKYWACEMIEACAKRGVSHIIHLGDYGFKFALPFRYQVEQALAKHNITLYFVDGNHDHHGYIWNCSMDDYGFHNVSPHVKAIPRGKRFWVWNLKFLGLGGAVSVDKDWRTQEGANRDWWDTEEVMPSQLTTARTGGKVDVMVTHDAPSGIPIPGISLESGLRFFPYHSLMNADRHRDLIRSVVTSVQPKLLVHGHYHVDYEHVESHTGLRVVGKDMDATSFDRNIYLARGPQDLIGHFNEETN